MKRCRLAPRLGVSLDFLPPVVIDLPYVLRIVAMVFKVLRKSDHLGHDIAEMSGEIPNS